MDDGPLLLWLSIMLLFLVINGLFVAVEFALISMRKTRIQELLDEGHWQAPLLHKLKSNINLSVSGMQLGITLASLALGWIGEHSIYEVVKAALNWIPGLTGLEPPQGVGIAVSLLTLSLLHVVLGEQVPKVLALHMPERMLMLLARPYDIYARLMFPIIWLMNRLTELCLRVFGIKSSDHDEASIHTAEELEIIIDASHAAGELDDRDTDLLKRVFDMRELTAENVMIPRARMDCIEDIASLGEAVRFASKTKHSKLPVYRGSVEKVVGVLHTRDLFDLIAKPFDQPANPLRAIIRPVHVVRKDVPARTVLDDMRSRRIQMAIVTDEDDRLLGLVTMEDLLEKLVGDIYDEYDKLPMTKKEQDKAASTRKK
jgi:CBS domain containing-hemolysin-like protein